MMAFRQHGCDPCVREPFCHKFIALLPCLTCTFCHTYFSYKMAQHGSSPQRDTALPSPWYPVPKHQHRRLRGLGQQLLLTPHDCKIPELRGALSLPMFQLTAESCSGIFPFLMELHFQLFTDGASLLVL